MSQLQTIQHPKLLQLLFGKGQSQDFVSYLAVVPFHLVHFQKPVNQLCVIAVGDERHNKRENFKVKLKHFPKSQSLIRSLHKIDLNMHHIFPVSNSTWTDREYFSFSSFCFYYYSLNKISLHMGHNLLLQNLCSCNRCQSISVNLLCVLLTIFHSIDYFVDYERENFHQYLDHLNRFFFLLLSK